MNKTDTIKEEIDNDESTAEHEQQLATELELISLLRENKDILQRHPDLLAVLEVPHQSGSAVSLIERQVSVLREQIAAQDKRLHQLMDVARDNERLADSRHRLALNLLAAHDLEDVTSIVLDMMSNELSADHAVFKLFSTDKDRVEQSSGLFVDTADEALNAFKTMLEQKNTVCGRGTEEQKNYLFAEEAAEIESIAVIPLVSGANLGLIGLGSRSPARFKSSMGTDFLSQIGELVSASIALHLES